MLHRSKLLVCSLLTLITTTIGRSEERDPYYFYHGRDYGSQAVYNPLTFVLNSGFGIVQYPNLPREWSAIHYGTGIRNVSRNLANPFSAIRAYGWSNFVRDELFPTRLNQRNGQYWSNYKNHFLGGGMNFVEAAEWYRYHGFQRPILLGIVSIAASHMVNEIIENDDYVGPNVDPIADFYVFNPLGILFFSLDGVSEFFSHTLNMAGWHSQPTIDPVARTLENHGQNYSIKYKLPFSDRVSVFYYWGMSGMLGGSYRMNQYDHLSLGAGMRAKRLYPMEEYENARKMTADLTWSAGLFYDRNNSLLASLLVSGVSDYRVHANIYPGIVRIGRLSPGFFCAVSTTRSVVSGLSLNILPVGLATRIRK